MRAEMAQKQATMSRRCGWLNAWWILLMAVGCGREFAKPPGPGVVEGKLEVGAVNPEPVADARVRLVECGLSVRSEADGDFRIYGVPSGEYTARMDTVLLVDGQEQAYSAELDDSVLVVGPAVTNLGALRLNQAGQVGGMVAINDGSPALNTVIYVVGGDAIAHAGHDGRFRLDAVPPGSRQIGAARPGYMLAQAQTVTVSPGLETELNLNLEAIAAGATGRVAGTVVLGNPGPAPGVLVELVERFRSQRMIAQTDAEGRWLLAEVPVGYYELSSRHPGYRSVGMANLEIRAGADLQLPTLVLVPESSAAAAHPADADANGRLDDDSDGVADSNDNCPVVPNADQVDSDGDGVGDACTGGFLPTDRDGDAVVNASDNCPDQYNPLQANHDEDPLGDACDTDDDNDGLLDPPLGDDACPLIADPGNDPGLCLWSLIYAGQDLSGNIHLNLHEMTPEGGFSRPLTQGTE